MHIVKAAKNIVLKQELILSKTKEFYFYFVILIILLALIITFSALSPQFFSANNFLNLLRQLAPNVIAGCGMTYIIASGGIDLSIGALIAVVGVVVAISTTRVQSLAIVLMIGLSIGLFAGGISGYFIVFHRIPAFIVTLGIMAVLRGIALVLTRGFSFPIDPIHSVISLGRGWLVGLPVPVWIAMTTLVLTGAFFNLTQYGIYTAGIGSNEEAVRRAGVNVKRLRLFLYCFNGLLASLAGIVLAARVGTGSSYVGQGFELTVITSVILGGTPLTGGEARLLGTVLGTFLLGLVGNGLVMARISPYFSQIAEGGILLISILANKQIRGYIQKWLKI
ncbi:MAG: ABC transporter permease [Candidatus Bathyarchaeia archaeon]